MAQSASRALRNPYAFASTAVLAAALCSGAAHGQAFQGSPSVTQGTVSFDRTTPGAETITVLTNTATINWTPTDNTGTGGIDFLPSGTTAKFVNDPMSVSNYTVLNRIVPADPSRKLLFNGNVVSRLQDFSGNMSQGGSVWFYSPGGIVIGATAVFDVGSLLLTTADPVTNPQTGEFLLGNSFSVAAQPGSTAEIFTNPGSQINALAEGSYVAFISPNINHNGTVVVNGSAAYVAAEAANITINQGLFDIAVTAGTSSAFPLTHQGTTTGPASTGTTGDNHHIYMVAVPKNDAITMLISASGSLGFEPATTAGVENGVIVLSAGHDVVGGQILSDPVNATAASAHIIGGNFTSRVDGRAAADFFANAGSIGSLSFAHDVALHAGARAHLGALTGQTVTVLGNADISTDRFDHSTMGGSSAGGQSLIFADSGATLDIAGNATVTAAGAGGGNEAGAGGTGTGGQALISSNGGTLRIGGSAFVGAHGFGGSTLNITADGGNGVGGFAGIQSFGGGSVTITGDATVAASGFGNDANGGTGGTGTGGHAAFSADGGTVKVGGSADAYSHGDGGGSFEARGGDGIGGIAELHAVNGGLLELDGSARIESIGFGGNGKDGGNGFGGDGRDFGNGLTTRSELFAKGGTITVALGVDIISNGFGGSAVTEAIGAGGGSGGNGTGGIAEIVASSGAGASAISVTSANVAAVGAGGTGGTGITDGAGGAGGNGTGGRALAAAMAARGTLAAGSVHLNSSGFGGQGGEGGGGSGIGGNGGAGGIGTGGLSQGGTISGPGSATLTGSATINSLSAFANGVGGLGGAGGLGSTGQGNGGAGGAGTGGGSYLLARGSLVTAGDADLVAFAAGGAGGAGTVQGAGGAGTGGAIGAGATGHFVTGAAGTLNVGTVSGSASGFGGAGSTAGADIAGTAELLAVNSQANFANVFFAAHGGVPASPGTPSAIRASGGTITVTGDVSLDVGGDVTLFSDNGLVDIAGELFVHAGGSFVVGESGTPPATPTTIRGNLVVLQSVGDFRTASTIESRNALSIVAGGVVSTGTLVAGTDLFLTGAGDVAVGNASAGGDLELVSTGGTLAVTAADAKGDLDLTAQGAVTAGALNAGDSVSAESVTAGVSITSATAGIVNRSSDPAARYLIGVDAATDATLGTLQALGDIGVLARTGDVGAGNISAGRNVIALAGDAVRLAGVATGASDALYIGHASMFSLVGPSLDPAPLLAATPVRVGSTIAITGPVQTGRLAAAATGDLTAAGAITAASRIDIDSGARANFNGVAAAGQITIGSNDIAIGSSGGLGNGSTQAISLNIGSGASGITIGGAGSATGYVLDSNEAGRLRAEDISLAATGSGTAANITVQDLTLAGSGGAASANLVGPTGRFRIQTPSSIRVTGAVRINDAASGNRLSFVAGTRFELTTEAGSIALLDSTGGLGGVLEAAARNIAVGTTALVDQLALDPRFQGRDAELAKLPGTPRPEGYLQAGRIVFGVGDTLMIQNSGTPLMFGGFTAGTGGLEITSFASSSSTSSNTAATPSPAEVNIYGRTRAADGSFVVNEKTIGTVTFTTGSGSAGFNPASSVNGCAISATVCAPPVEALPKVSSELQGVIETQEEQPGEAEAEDEIGILQLELSTPVIDMGSLVSERPIEEPVGGGGNSSLWGQDGQETGDDQ